VTHARKSVLVVEDDIDIVSSLAEVIRDEGFKVQTAANGYQALMQVEQHQPALIFLDLMLPQMNGWRFVQEMRARFPDTSVPIVLVSAVQDIARAAARLGARHFLRKPFDLADIVRITHEHCRTGDSQSAPAS
jgi:CheY-like chemotaxis protein